MTTTVIMARSYEDAAEYARARGLGRDWLYPHNPAMLYGMHVRRAVYLAGWLHSDTITVETAEVLQNRLAPDAEVFAFERIGSDTILPWSSEPQAAVSAPFIQSGALEAQEDRARAQKGRQRGLGTPLWLWVLTLAIGGSAAVAVVGRIAGAW